MTSAVKFNTDIIYTPIKTSPRKMSLSSMNDNMPGQRRPARQTIHICTDDDGSMVYVVINRIAATFWATYHRIRRNRDHLLGAIAFYITLALLAAPATYSIIMILSGA